MHLTAALKTAEPSESRAIVRLIEMRESQLIGLSLMTRHRGRSTGRACSPQRQTLRWWRAEGPLDRRVQHKASSVFIRLKGTLLRPEIARAILAGPTSHVFVAKPFPQQQRAQKSYRDKEADHERDWPRHCSSRTPSRMPSLPASHLT